MARSKYASRTSTRILAWYMHYIQKKSIADTAKELEVSPTAVRLWFKNDGLFLDIMNSLVPEPNSYLNELTKRPTYIPKKQDGSDQTVQQVFESLTDIQKKCVYFLIGQSSQIKHEL